MERRTPRARAAATLPILLAAIAIASVAPRAAHAQEGARREQQTPPPAPKPVLTKPPELVEAVAPEYPPAALAAGKTAAVKVRIHIDATGIVTKVDVIEPVGDGFDEAAVAAAMLYVFTPAEYDGKPAPIIVETVINFVLEEQIETVDEPPPTPPAPGTTTPGHAGDETKPITITGEAVERGTRSKLPGVIVSITELRLDAVTDERGRFFFHGVAPGKYTILAVGDKYDRLRRPITLDAKEQVDVRLWLRPRGGNPYETVVEGEREVLEVTRRSLQRQQLTSVPGTFGDPIRVIQSLPGLSRAPFVLGVLIIRGSNPDDTGIFIDGHRVPLIFHFLGGPSILNPDFVESLDLYPGGYPARYGRGHGGVVAIESRPSKSDGVHGAADVDFLDSSVYVRAPLTKKLSVAAAGRRSYIDVFLPLFLPEPEEGARQVVVPVYYDYQARADLDLDREGRASVFLLGSSDVLDVLSENPDDEVTFNLNSRIDFFRVIGTYKRPLGGNLNLTLSPAWGRDLVSFAGGMTSGSAFTSAEIRQTTLSYRARVNGRLNDWAILDTGLDIESRVTRYDLRIPLDDDIRSDSGVDIPPEQLTRGNEQLGAGVHIDLGLDLGPLRLVPGLRLDAYSLGGEERLSIDPRLVGRLRLSSMWTAKAYVGMFHQPPQPEAFDYQFGNPRIGMEQGIHTGIGAEWRPDRLWLVDAEAYYVDRDDLVYFTSEVIENDNGSVTPINFDNRGYGRTFGVELLIKREISERAFGWLSYTYSNTRRRTFDPDSDEMLPTGLDQPHTLNAVASYKPGGGWELGARYRFSSGRPETPIFGGTFDGDSGGYAADAGDGLSTRAPFFHQLDLRAEKMWLYNTWSFGLYLDVQNVLFTDNVEAYEYDYRYRERAAITGVPFVPTLGIRGTW